MNNLATVVPETLHYRSNLVIADSAGKFEPYDTVSKSPTVSPQRKKIRLRLLLIGNNHSDRLDYKRELSEFHKRDYVIFEAENGRQGLKLARAQQPDCILLIHYLADMEGADFIAELTKESGELSAPVIIVQESDNAASMIDARVELGNYDYIVKDMKWESIHWLLTSVFHLLREQKAISEKEKTIAKLHEAEAKYQTLVKQIPAITYIASLEIPGKLLYISPQIAQLGFPAEAWLADNLGVLKRVHADDMAVTIEAYAHTYEHHAPLRCEYRLLANNGQVRWFSDEAYVVKDAQGGSLFLQGVLVDITKDKETERELFYYRRRLEELVQQRTVELEKQCALLKIANGNLDNALCELRQTISASRICQSCIVAEVA